MFKIIDTYEQAVPLSEAGLLWYRMDDEGTWDADPPGYWGEQNGPNHWVRLTNSGCVHAILLEE